MSDAAAAASREPTPADSADESSLSDRLTDGIEAERRRIADLTPEVALALYGSFQAKRLGLDTMMWQTPALGLVAQSFLLVVALGPDYSWTARLTAASLGIVAALASVQLLLKHRYNEFLHAVWLEKFATERDLPGASPKSVCRLAFGQDEHEWELPPRPDKDEMGHDKKLTVRRRVWHWARWKLVKYRSVHVWAVALTIFGVAQASVFVLGLVELLGGGSAL
jgi:hypothetical protein